MVRFKTRHLVFELMLEDDQILESLSTSQIYSVLRDSIQTNFGSHGLGTCSSLQIKYFSPYTKLGILRISRDQFRTVWAALLFINQIKGIPCAFRVLRTSGTIKCTQEFIIDYNNKTALRLQKESRISQEKSHKVELNLQKEIKKL
jgi:ribonuclease P/MRP protein subunit POP5